MKTPRIWLAAALIALCALSAQPAWSMDFNRPTLEGQALSLSQFRGRVVLLDFFATWCGPCTQAMPKLRQLQNAYGHAGLSIVGYSVDSEGLEAVGPYAARNRLNFPVVLGNAAEAKRIADVTALPTTVIIDPEGRVAARFEGPVSKERLIDVIKPYLREGATPAPPAAKVELRADGANRFSRVWVTPNMLLQGQLGLFVHTVVDVSDLYTKQGLWLGITMTPETIAPDGSTRPQGPPVTKYQRVDEAWRKHFIMFLTCGQMPPMTGRGAYRSQVFLLGPGEKILERSEDFWISDECQTGAAGPPSQFEEARMDFGGGGPRKTGMVGKWRWAGQDRLRGAWLTGPTVHQGRSGLFVHVDADFSQDDLKRGLALGLDFAGAAQGRSATPRAESRLVQPVETDNPGYYIMFIGCDQLPAQVAGGDGAMWISLLAGPERQEMERSGVFIIDEAICDGRAASQTSGGRQRRSDMAPGDDSLRGGF